MELDEELKQLQQQLALVDLVTRRRPQRPPGLLEELIVRLGPLKMKMYQEAGHQRPHIHVDYGRRSHMASYSIDDGRRLAGKLESKYDREIVRWIVAHRDKLLERWHALNSGMTPEVIIGELGGT